MIGWKIIPLTAALMAASPAVLPARIISDMEIGPAVDLSFTNAEWQSSFPGGTLNGMPARIVSVLRFNDLSATSLSARARCTLYDLVDLQLSFSPSAWTVGQVAGRGTDSDLARAGSMDFLFSESQFSNRSLVSSYEIQALFPLTASGPSERRLQLKALLGYFRTDDEVHLFQGVQTVSETEDTPAAGTLFPDLDSSYRFKWDSFAAGLHLSWAYPAGISFTTSLAALANYYSADGFWNLRTLQVSGDPFAWRDTPPNYTHNDARGTGFLFEFAPSLLLSPSSRVTVIYRYLYLYAGNGSEQIFFSDPSLNPLSSDISLDRVRMEKNKVSLLYSLRF